MQAKSGSSLCALLLRSVVLYCPLAFLTSCGGQHSITNPPPVSAQQSYSNASLSGSYAITGVLAMGRGNGTLPNCCPGGIPILARTIQFDGAGHITGGFVTYTQPETDYEVQNNEITGTYSISSDGSGTATISFQLDGGQEPDPILNSKGLGYSPTNYPFTLQVAQQGGVVVLTANQPTTIIGVYPYISITGFKQ
jgi:hypothetical protein